MFSQAYGIQVMSGAAHHNACAYHINHLEKIEKIPDRLLSAIAKVESGRVLTEYKHVPLGQKREGKKLVAWPWVVHTQGKGYYFPSKQEAVKAVKSWQSKGIRNIDVGCMQINLGYHGDAFYSVEHAFDPRANVAYAAKFLKQLKEAHSSWTKAVSHYHSANPEFHLPYRQKVYDMWKKEHLDPRPRVIPLRSDSKPQTVGWHPVAFARRVDHHLKNGGGSGAQQKPLKSLSFPSVRHPVIPIKKIYPKKGALSGVKGKRISLPPSLPNQTVKYYRLPVRVQGMGDKKSFR